VNTRSHIGADALVKNDPAHVTSGIRLARGVGARSGRTSLSGAKSDTSSTVAAQHQNAQRGLHVAFRVLDGSSGFHEASQMATFVCSDASTPSGTREHSRVLDGVLEYGPIKTESGEDRGIYLSESTMHVLTEHKA
jgi:hypothetical protein